ncbi:MAG: hypothetical protein ACLTJG_02220 [[Clostridium] innocuum]
MYNAAQYAGTAEHMELIQLAGFGCESMITADRLRYSQQWKAVYTD